MFPFLIYHHIIVSLEAITIMPFARRNWQAVGGRNGNGLIKVVVVSPDQVNREIAKVEVESPVVAAIQDMKAVTPRLHIQIRESRAIYGCDIALENGTPEWMGMRSLLLREI